MEIKLSDSLIKFVKKWERFEGRAVSIDGLFSKIGYGHKIRSRHQLEYYEMKVKKNKLTINEANQILMQDLQEAAKYLRIYVKVKLEKYEREALISLIYNWGVGNFGSSKIRNLLNYKEYEEALEEMLKVVEIKGEDSEILKERRLEEKEVFLRGWEALESFNKERVS